MRTTTAPPITAPRAADPTAVAVSVVIPCLNEAESIEECVIAARSALDEGGYSGEIIVVDNGSTDGSGELAAAAGATVISEPKRGYGNAYLAGLSAARGAYIVMLDADLTYDAAELPKFVDELEAGGDLVLGDRMEGIQPGAMPWLHQHVGNPDADGPAQHASSGPTCGMPTAGCARSAATPFPSSTCGQPEWSWHLRW